mmetsp:Transcript_15222/g.38693  ORF Transcript_15222/g.38693 Transcript_15222/m.38693 type:complete len:227 (+) Transcript_15222:364-1044(+)
MPGQDADVCPRPAGLLCAPRALEWALRFPPARRHGLGGGRSAHVCRPHHLLALPSTQHQARGQGRHRGYRRAGAHRGADRARVRVRGVCLHHLPRQGGRHPPPGRAPRRVQQGGRGGCEDLCRCRRQAQLHPLHRVRARRRGHQAVRAVPRVWRQADPDGVCHGTQPQCRLRGPHHGRALHCGVCRGQLRQLHRHARVLCAARHQADDGGVPLQRHQRRPYQGCKE